jgi:hypothetical protein
MTSGAANLRAAAYRRLPGRFDHFAQDLSKEIKELVAELKTVEVEP